MLHSIKKFIKCALHSDRFTVLFILTFEYIMLNIPNNYKRCATIYHMKNIRSFIQIY